MPAARYASGLRRTLSDAISVNIPGDATMVYRQARLLAATILLTILFLLLAVPLSAYVLAAPLPFVLLFVGISVVLAGVYVVNRAGDHVLAARLFVATAVVGAWGYSLEVGALDPQIATFGHLLLPVLFAGLFLGFWSTFLVTVASLLFGWYSGVATGLEPTVVVRGLLLLGLVGAVMGSNAYIRSMISEEVHAASARMGRETADRRALMESSPDAIFELDLGMRIVGTNGTARRQCRAWGTTAPDVGVSLHDALPEPVLDFVRHASPGPATSLDSPVERKLQWDDDDGEVHLGSLSGVEDEEGAVIGFILRVRDISNFASLERAHEADVEALKRRMLNTAAHELNTPLTPIQLGIHALMQDTDHLSQRHRKALQTVKRNVDRLQVQVKEFLEVAVASDERVHLERRPVRFDDLLEAAMDEVEDMPAVERLRVAARPGSDATVRVDVERLHRVMVHLIRNAMQHAPDGGHVEVQTQYLDDGQVQFTVTDDGVGFDPMEADSLFEPFTSEHDEGGRGFGLYICKRVVEAHGGRIDAKSEGPGKGSTFSFRVPVDTEARRSPPAEAERLSPIRPRPSVESYD